MRIQYPLYLCFFYVQVMCNTNGIVNSKNPLPYFRRQVEELTEDTTIQTTLSDELVSFLIKNVKEIYNELDEISHLEQYTSTSVRTLTTERFFDGTTPTEVTPDNYFENSIEPNLTSYDTETSVPDDVTTVSNRRMYLNEMPVYNNVTLLHFSDTEIVDVDVSTTAYGLTEKEELMHLSKNLQAYEMDRKQRDSELQPLMTYGNGSLLENNNSDFGLSDRSRSCILCNNVVMEECSNPKNRLIPAIVCERNDDLCYSMHTPFGVVDRGCFNVNHNLTTYVCSCNLCNYISISEMPYIFSKKHDWVDNVVELSRTRHFRKSVFKDMSCLKCETNATAKTGDMLDTANCLEGNIGSLPTEECKEDEICAVKAMRKDGFIWRGCIRYPIYNYWWSLCDSDLCNYDAVKSIYDFEQ